MIGIDWNDSETYWLNVTNAGLGVVACGLFLAIIYSIVVDVFIAKPDHGRGRTDDRRS